MKRAAWCDRTLCMSPIYYAAVFTEKDFHRELRSLNVPQQKWPAWVAKGSTTTVHRLERLNGKECAIVCMRPSPEHNPIELACVLVHEAVHIWQWICESIGEDEPSSEFEAYSVQWISQQLMFAYRDFLARPA